MADKQINIVAKVDTKEVKEGSSAFEELKEKVKDLSSEIPGLGPLLNGVGSSLSGLGESLNIAQVGLVGITAAIPALVVALGALGVGLAFKFAEKLDGFNDLGAKFGITADQAYYLSTAAQQAGGSLEAVMATSQRLSKAMSNSSDEMKGAGAAFKALGVETTDSSGKLRSNEDVMKDLLGKWEKSKKTASDFAAMQQVLGKNFEEQIPVINSVIEANKIANEAYNNGIGISKASLEATNNLEKAQLSLGGVFNSMRSILVEAVIPAFTSLIQWFVKSYTEGGVVAKGFTAIAVSTEILMVGVKGLVAGIEVLITAFTSLGSIGGTVFSAIWKAMTGDFAGAKQTLISGLGEVNDKVLGLADSIKKIGMFSGTSTIKKLLSGENPINRDKSELDAPTSDIFRGAAGGDPTALKPQSQKADTSQNAIESLISSLQRQAIAQQGINKEDAIAIELQNKKYDLASQENKDDAIKYAQMIDNSNAIKLLTSVQKDLTTQTTNYVNSIQDEINGGNENQRIVKQNQELKKLDVKLEQDLNELKTTGLWTLERENQLLAANREARTKITDATKTAMDYDSDWFSRGFDEYKKSVGDLNTNLASLAESGIKGFGDQITSLVTTGSTSFKSFIADMIKQLANLVVQMYVVIPLMESLKSAMSGGTAGGVGSFVASLFSAQGNIFPSHAQGVVNYAQLGFYGQGTASTVGEAGPEAVLPLGKNAAGDLGVKVNGQLGGQSISVETNVTVQMSGSSEDEAKKTGKIVSDLVDAKIQEALVKAQRPGGSMNPARISVGG